MASTIKLNYNIQFTKYDCKPNIAQATGPNVKNKMSCSKPQ